MTRILDYGPDALLVELGSLEAVEGFSASLSAAARPGLEVVPAAATVVVLFDGETVDRDELREWLGNVELAPAADRSGSAVVEISVRYDGPDLDEVAERVGLEPGAVVARHSAALYRVAFCGFAPGFAYLTGLDPVLHVARRATPRTSVAAGAVAIAAGYSAVYPASSPGGWHVLGRTDAIVWDIDRDPPALLAPGTRVRFVAV